MYDFELSYFCNFYEHQNKHMQVAGAWYGSNWAFGKHQIEMHCNDYGRKSEIKAKQTLSSFGSHPAYSYMLTCKCHNHHRHRYFNDSIKVKVIFVIMIVKCNNHNEMSFCLISPAPSPRSGNSENRHKHFPISAFSVKFILEHFGLHSGKTRQQKRETNVILLQLKQNLETFFYFCCLHSIGEIAVEMK